MNHPSVSAEKELKKLRKQIDIIDRSLLSILCKRFQVVRRIGRVKIKYGLPILQTKRRQQLKSERQAIGQKLGLASSFVESLFNMIQAHAIMEQKMMVQEMAKARQKRGRK